MPDTRTKDVRPPEARKAPELPAKFKDAQKEFERLKEEIAPFIKKHDRTEPTTEGEWRDARSLDE